MNLLCEWQLVAQLFFSWGKYTRKSRPGEGDQAHGLIPQDAKQERQPALLNTVFVKL